MMRTAQLGRVSSLSLASDSYIYDVQSTGSALTLISSDDSLRFIDPATLLESAPGAKNAHAGITCLATDPQRPHTLTTAGRDGAMQAWDIRTASSVLQMKTNAPILSASLQGDLVAVGTELTSHQASIHIWDMRILKQPYRTYIEVHNDDVTTLQFDSCSPNTLLSGSTDGLVNLIDTTTADEEDCLLQVFNHGSSIHRASFLPQTSFPSRHIHALSHDEIFSIYPLDGYPSGAISRTEPEPQQPQVFGDLRQPLKCEYIVDVHTLTDGTTCIVAGSHTGSSIDLIPLRQTDAATWTLEHDKSLKLPGAHGQEIVRAVCSLPDRARELVYTAGEDGCVRSWTTDMAVDETVLRTGGIVRSAGTKGASKSRYRPY